MRKFIRVANLASTPRREGRLPVSPATLWRWVEAGKFPPPVKLGDGITAWRMEDVERWEREREACRTGASEPYAEQAQP